MFRRVTMPSIGDSMRTLLQVVAARFRALARSCMIAAVLRLRALLALLTAPTPRLRRRSPPLSSVSRVVSCCFHRPCWRVQRLLRLLELHARGFDRLPHLLERRRRHLQRRLAAVDARAQRLRIDLQQELARLDAVAFVDGEVDDAARVFRRVMLTRRFG